jgi:hypothetical protein
MSGAAPIRRRSIPPAAQIRRGDCGDLSLNIQLNIALPDRSRRLRRPAANPSRSGESSKKSNCFQLIALDSLSRPKVLKISRLVTLTDALQSLNIALNKAQPPAKSGAPEASADPSSGRRSREDRRI